MYRIEGRDVEFPTQVVQRFLDVLPEDEVRSEGVSSGPQSAIPGDPELGRIQRPWVAAGELVEFDAQVPGVDHGKDVTGHREDRVHPGCEGRNQKLALRCGVVAGTEVRAVVRCPEDLVDRPRMPRKGEVVPIVEGPELVAE
jgi:hypothetical protein